MSQELLPHVQIAQGTAAMLRDAARKIGEPNPAAGCPLYKEFRAYRDRDALERYAFITGLTDQIKVDYIGDLPVASWDELSHKSAEILIDEASNAFKAMPEALTHEQKAHVSQLIERDGRAGLAQITAFLEVIPRVLVDVELVEIDGEIKRRADMSKGAIVKWSKAHVEMDADLVAAVTDPKPDYDAAYPYDGIRYGARWFEVKANGAIGFNPLEMPNMRNDRGQKIDFRQKRVGVLGCPALIVPELYDAMAFAAEANQLFSRTYQDERTKRA